jgi:membrane protein DedA with SNARE-associated domain
VVGDSIGDSMYYAIGRYGGNITWIKKIGYFLGYSQKIKVSLINHFDRHTTKTLLLAKFSHGLGSAVQVTAGLAKINFSKYLSIEVLGTLLKTLILFVLGFYIGESYEQINNYLQMIAITVIGVVIFVISYFTLNNYQNK